MILFPSPKAKFFDNNGRPMVGGLLFTYAAGTSTPIETAKDQAGTLNTNPIVLDYRGECDLWGDPTLVYKLVLAPPNDTTPPTAPIWEVDDIAIPGAGGSGGTPGDPNHSIQFNSGGNFGGSAKLLYDDGAVTITFGEVNGDAFLTAPSATGADTGGNLTILAGDSVDEATSEGGALSLFGGSGEAEGGNAELAGGLVGHAGGPARGAGGDAILRGGDDTSDGGSTGGNARVIGGESANGTPGSVRIEVDGALFLEVLPDGSVEIAGDPGTAGDVLTSAGAGAPIAWSAAASVPNPLSSIKENRIASNQFTPDGYTITALTSGSFSSLSPATNLLGTFKYAIDTSPAGSTDRQAAFYGTVTGEYIYQSTSGDALGGGYDFFARFFWLTAIAAQRAFGGLSSFAGGIMNQTQEPSAQVNCAFIGKDAADTNLFFMHNDGSGTCTKVDSGVAFSTLIGHILDLSLSCAPGGGPLSFSVTDKTTGALIMSGVASTNLPAADVGLLPAFIANTGTQTAAVELGYSHIKAVTNF